METEKEKMLALLQNFTTTIDANNMSITNIVSLPNTRIHSSSNLHSTANSVRSSNANIPQSSSFQFGSIHSFTTSANVTPLPTKKFPGPPDSDAGTDLLNICRICQLPGSDSGDDILFSACRCSGSLKYVHDSCLLRWIEYSTRKNKKPAMCELCHYPYTRHKRFKFQFNNWRWPRVSKRDKCLHIIFLLTLVIMVACAVATVMCFLSDSGQISQTNSELSAEEVTTLTCGVLFFVSFFLAMTVEIRARHTLHYLIQKFITQNTEWQIEPYDKAKDPSCPKPYLYV